jgi:hypothetical protein
MVHVLGRQHRFLDALLGESDVITANPDEADILVVPALASNMFACVQTRSDWRHGRVCMLSDSCVRLGVHTQHARLLCARAPHARKFPLLASASWR